MAIKKETLDHLLDGRDPKEVFNKDGLFDELKKALAEHVLNAEIDDHLDGETAEGRKNHSRRLCPGWSHNTRRGLRPQRGLGLSGILWAGP